MRFITSLTRMWLTRTVRPFTFKNEYDRILPFAECERLGLYIHIPFCKTICNFCPYCKVRYSAELCDKYIDSLIHEIHLIGGQYPGRKKTTGLYFGGGTPALAVNRIKEIIDALNEHFIIPEEIGLELHPDDVSAEVLQALKDAGVTKISIGIQSFCEKYQYILGRKKIDAENIAAALTAVPFETVSMDFIFALPGQTYDDLRSDIDKAFSIGANHIAIYPFIDFTFTKSQVKEMPKKEKRRLLDSITQYCQDKGYSRNSIWTFSSEPNANYSSMTRENFIGFGCSATSLFKEQFKINTFDVEAYCRRIQSDTPATSLTIRFTKHQRMIYWLFWTAYSTRVRESDFEKFFGVPLKKAYGLELWIAKRAGFIKEHNGTYEMTPKGAFYYHYYENFYTLSYIDKMWGIMRKEAFPDRITLS
ncbi:MAG: radical SAM protein [Clostridia bacterium]|nr:radical SAM protein [Clostridia bacterium]